MSIYDTQQEDSIKIVELEKKCNVLEDENKTLAEYFIKLYAALFHSPDNQIRYSDLYRSTEALVDKYKIKFINIEKDKVIKEIKKLEEKLGKQANRQDPNNLNLPERKLWYELQSKKQFLNSLIY